MVKKPLTLYLSIFGILAVFILTFNLHIEKEKLKAIDEELQAELIEEQKVQDSVRSYISSLKTQNIEKYNSVVIDDLKLNTKSLFFTKIMLNVFNTKFIGDNLSVIHLKSNDQSVTVKVKYEITFINDINPEGIYTSGNNKCKVSIDLIKVSNMWIIKKVYDLSVDL